MGANDRFVKEISAHELDAVTDRSGFDGQSDFLARVKPDAGALYGPRQCLLVAMHMKRPVSWESMLCQGKGEGHRANR
jgi:hypothetical protein